MIYQLRLKKWGSLISITALLMACFELHPENTLQKKRVYAIEEALNARKIISKDDTLIVMGSLQNYHPACAINNPVIKQEHCLVILVEGDTLRAADADTRALAESLKKYRINDSPKLSLSGSTVVFIPGVRSKEYKGEITPYALTHFFSTGKPYFFKLEN